MVNPHDLARDCIRAGYPFLLRNFEGLLSKAGVELDGTESIAGVCGSMWQLPFKLGFA